MTVLLAMQRVKETPTKQILETKMRPPVRPKRRLHRIKNPTRVDSAKLVGATLSRRSVTKRVKTIWMQFRTRFRV